MSAIHADGGGDTPEDIMGALKATFTKLSWRSDCSKVNICLILWQPASYNNSCVLQVLIHIADAPCHGSQYYPSGTDDNYPAGDPAGISHYSMMAEVVKLDLQYWFGYINKQLTDQMIKVFNDSLREQSDKRLLIRQFDAVQPDEVSQAVHR